MKEKSKTRRVCRNCAVVLVARIHYTPIFSTYLWLCAEQHFKILHLRWFVCARAFWKRLRICTCRLQSWQKEGFANEQRCIRKEFQCAAASDLFCCLGRKTIMLVMGSFQACRASFFSGREACARTEEKAFTHVHAHAFSLSLIYSMPLIYSTVCIYAKVFFISLRGWHTFFPQTKCKQKLIFFALEARAWFPHIINYTRLLHTSRGRLLARSRLFYIVFWLKKVLLPNSCSIVHEWARILMWSVSQITILLFGSLACIVYHLILRFKWEKTLALIRQIA